jgi:hypothetical protein
MRHQIRTWETIFAESLMKGVREARRARQRES